MLSPSAWSNKVKSFKVRQALYIAFKDGETGCTHSRGHLNLRETKAQAIPDPELRRLGFGAPAAPDGAFYVLADAHRFGSDPMELVR